jgi:putative transposase
LADQRARYVWFVEQGVSENELSLMHEALQHGQLTGTYRFVGEVEKMQGCRIERRSTAESYPAEEQINLSPFDPRRFRGLENQTQ